MIDKKRRTVTAAKNFQMNWRYHIKAYLGAHRHAMGDAARQLCQRRAMSLVIIIMMGIGLSLPLLLALAMDNAQDLNNHLGDERQISVFLKSLDEQQTQTFSEKMRQHQAIEYVQHVSPEEGLALFEKSTGQSNILSQLPHNPLPALLEIIPTLEFSSPDAIKSLVTEIDKMPEVASVKIDMDWIKKLHQWLSVLELGFYLLVTLLIFGVLLVNLHTVYYAIREHRDEIHVIYLMGGTQSFIRRPYLYMGFLYGLFSACCAWLCTMLVLLSLEPLFSQLFNLYNLPWHMIHINVSSGLLIVFFSCVMGWLGAWFASETELLHAMQSSN